jgi:hypothetical protein
MLCPLCQKEIGGAYASESLVLRSHLVQEHVGDSDIGMSQPSVRCVCNKEYRGLTSFSKHIATLQGEELEHHVILTSMGTLASAMARQRGHERYVRSIRGVERVPDFQLERLNGTTETGYGDPVAEV